MRRTLFFAEQQDYISSLINDFVVNLPNELTWLAILVVLEGLATLPLIVGATLLLLRRDARGIELAALGPLLSLTMINLLVFYFDQFLALTDTFIHFTLLMLALHYRRRFLPLSMLQRTRPKAVAEASRVR